MFCETCGWIQKAPPETETTKTMDVNLEANLTKISAQGQTNFKVHDMVHVITNFILCLYGLLHIYDGLFFNYILDLQHWWIKSQHLWGATFGRAATDRGKPWFFKVYISIISLPVYIFRVNIALHIFFSVPVNLIIHK